MFHFFDKIYVCPDFLLDSTKRHIIISKTYSKSNPNAFSSIHELIGNGKKFNTWYDFLLAIGKEDKFRIYADVESLAYIFIGWIKTIFPNMNQHLAYKFYNTAVQRLKIHFSGATLNGNFLRNHKSELMDVKFLNKVQFYDLFDCINVWEDDQQRRTWVENNKELFSIEWHLAVYFNDKQHLSVFRDKYIYVLSKALAMEVSEWYFYVVKYFMQPGVKRELGIDIKWDSDDWRQQLKSYPKLAWMFDDNLKYVTRDSTYFLAHIDEILDLGKKLQNFWFKDIPVDNKNRLLDEDYFESNHAHFVFDTLSRLLKNYNSMSDEEINAIIDADFEAENVSIMFDILTHVIKWNPYMLQLIYELKNTNSDELKQMVFK
jgi:hypothetical protein